MYVCMFHDMCAEVRGQLQELVLSSVLWVLGLELKALDLSASTLPAGPSVLRRCCNEYSRGS